MFAASSWRRGPKLSISPVAVSGWSHSPPAALRDLLCTGLLLNPPGRTPGDAVSVCPHLCGRNRTIGTDPYRLQALPGIHSKSALDCAGWRSHGRTKCGRWTSPASRWCAASSILGRSSRRMLSEAAFCTETLEDALGRYAKPEIFDTDPGLVVHWPNLHRRACRQWHSRQHASRGCRRVLDRMIKLCRLQRRAPVQNFAPSVATAVRNAASAEALRHPVASARERDVPWAMLDVSPKHGLRSTDRSGAQGCRRWITEPFEISLHFTYTDDSKSEAGKITRGFANHFSYFDLGSNSGGPFFP